MSNDNTINTKEEAKKILKGYKQLLIRRNQLEKIVSKLEAEVINLKGPNYGDNSTGIGNSSITAKIAKLVDLKNELETFEDKCNSKLLEIESVLQLVAEKDGVIYANILHFKFVDFYLLDYIAELVGYSRCQTIRYYNESLNCFYTKYKEGVVANA